VGLEWGQLSLVSTIEELLGRKSSGSGLEIREYGRRDLSCWPHGTLYLQKLALTSSTSGGRSVGIIRSWNQATEFSFFYIYISPVTVCSSCSYWFSGQCAKHIYFVLSLTCCIVLCDCSVPQVMTLCFLTFPDKIISSLTLTYQDVSIYRVENMAAHLFMLSLGWIGCKRCYHIIFRMVFSNSVQLIVSLSCLFLWYRNKGLTHFNWSHSQMANQSFSMYTSCCTMLKWLSYPLITLVNNIIALV
jgi:hypothetical protein